MITERGGSDAADRHGFGYPDPAGAENAKNCRCRDRHGKERMDAGSRETGYDLLRILAMFMVLTLHFLSQTDSLIGCGRELTGVRFAGSAAESLSIVAVNCFVLMSGYFLSEKGFRIEKLLLLFLQVLFYSCLIPLVLTAAGIPLHAEGLWAKAVYLLPVSSEHYWFFTSYIIMYLFSPVLSRAVRELPEKQIRGVLLLLFMLLCLVPSLSPVQLQADRYGYDPLWFLFLFLLGSFFRKYGIPVIGQGPKGLLLYLLCSAATWLGTVLLTILHEKTGGLAYYATVPLHYNALFVLLGAVGLFSFFGKPGKISAGAAKAAGWLAPLVFGVYLIHHHIDIRDRWTEWLDELFGALSEQPLLFILQMFGRLLIVFVLCLFLEKLRQLLFALIGKALNLKWKKAT